MKILFVPDNPKKRGQILNVACPCTPGVPFHEQMIQYPKAKFFPCVVEDNPSTIGGAGKQGVEKHVPEDNMGQPSAKRAKSNAEVVIQLTPPMQMADKGEGVAGEHIEVDDDVCSVDLNSLEADKPCSADSNMLETGEEDSVSNDEVDPGWEGMHSLEVNEMLDNKVDGEH